MKKPELPEQPDLFKDLGTEETIPIASGGSARKKERRTERFLTGSGERAVWVVLTPDFILKRTKLAGDGTPGILCDQCEKSLSVGDRAVRYTYKGITEVGTTVKDESILCSPECQHRKYERVKVQNERPIERY